MVIIECSCGFSAGTEAAFERHLCLQSAMNSPVKHERLAGSSQPMSPSRGGRIQQSRSPNPRPAPSKKTPEVTPRNLVKASITAKASWSRNQTPRDPSTVSPEKTRNHTPKKDVLPAPQKKPLPDLAPKENSLKDIDHLNSELIMLQAAVQQAEETVQFSHAEVAQATRKATEAEAVAAERAQVVTQCKEEVQAAWAQAKLDAEAMVKQSSECMYENEAAALRRDLEDKGRRLLESTRKIASLRKELDGVQRDDTGSDKSVKEVDRLKEVLSKSEHSARIATFTAKSNWKQCEILKEEVAEMRAATEEMRGTPGSEQAAQASDIKNIKMETRLQYEDELNAMKAQNASLRTELATSESNAQQDKCNWNARHNELVTQLRNMKDVAFKLQGDAIVLQATAQENEALREQNKALSDRVHCLEQEIAGFSPINDKYPRDLPPGPCAAEFLELHVELRQLQQRVIDADSDFQNLKRLADHAEAQRAGMANRAAAAEAEVLQLKRRVAAADPEVRVANGIPEQSNGASWVAHLVSKDVVVTSLACHVQGLEQRLAEQSSSRGPSAAEIQELQKCVKNAEAIASEQKRLADGAERKCAAARNRVCSAEEEVAQLKQRVTDLSRAGAVTKDAYLTSLARRVQELEQHPGNPATTNPLSNEAELQRLRQRVNDAESYAQEQKRFAISIESKRTTVANRMFQAEAEVLQLKQHLEKANVLVAELSKETVSTGVPSSRDETQSPPPSSSNMSTPMHRQRYLDDLGQT